MSRKILELANDIQAEATKIHDYLVSQGINEPSLEDLNTYWELPPDLDASRQNVLNATMELHERALKPQERLFRLDQSSSILTSFNVISAFEIAKALPTGEESTFEQLSHQCGLNECDTRRLLRLAMSYGVFREPRRGVVAHTPSSALLTGDSNMQDWLASFCEEILPAAVKTVPAMKKWPNSEEPQHSGFNLAHNTTLSMYNELERHPERAQQFANAMSCFTTGPGFNSDHVTDNFDWKALGKGLVVDCGGSHGAIMTSVLRKFPNLTIVVQDLESVINSRPELHLHGNEAIRFMVHDFFTPQPIRNADVYFFRWIFHGWSDKYCTMLLRNLVPALKPGAKILVNDFCLPEPGTLPLMAERQTRTMDVVQLNILNSHERDEYDYRKLFQNADQRFKVASIVKPSGSFLSLIEAVWHP